MKLKVRFSTKGSFLEVSATPFEYEGIQLFCHIAIVKDSEGNLKIEKSKGYSVSEMTTGLRVWSNFKKKKDAFELTKKALDVVGVEKTKAVIKEKQKELK